MIADGDGIVAKNIRSEYAHKLGNLTLTGHNSQLSNMSFDKKQNRTKEGKYIGFKNGLWLNQNLRDATRWTKDSIIERTEMLTEKALRLFKF